MSSRRKFFFTGAMAGLGMLIPKALPAQSANTSSKYGAKRVLRVAHLTDIHVQPEGAAPGGMAKALHAAQSLPDKPDLIFNTGDCIMDALGKTKERVADEWNTWNSILKNENSLEMVNCIGNHDVWGWSREHVSFAKDPLFGKEWAIENLKLKNRYYSFDRAGWHFIVLDSTHRIPGYGYTAKLDEEQFAWLAQDLANTKTEIPICVLSHIPILGVSVFFDGENMKHGRWTVPGSWMHQDAKEIKDLFYKHKNVKACLSGHIHLIDELEYLGVKYYCNGAVSGAWWGGSYHEFPPVFAVMNYYDDGSTDRELYYYDWK